VTGPEQARQDLAEILESGRLEIAEAQALMAQRGHPAGRVDRARRALEVETVRQGPPGIRQQFFWRLPTSCPTCMRPFSPDEGTASVPWGRDRDTIGDYWQEQTPPIEPESPEPAPHFMSPPPPQLDAYAPPVCDRCGKISAQERGAPCPWWNGPRLCGGTMT
jgi:hypothetical protein